MEEGTVKQRVGVKSGRGASYLRDSQSGVIASRPASLREHRDEVRRVWSRAAGLAMDMLQNSGRLRGVADQIIADTIGTALTLNPQPNLSLLGYDQKEAADFVGMVKSRFNPWCWNAAECHLQGKFNIHQQADIGMRSWMAFGESIGVVTYLPKAERPAGVQTGTKFSVVSPQRLVQDTNEVEGLFQGVVHDTLGRPIAYRMSERRSGLTVKRDYAARDADGRQLVMHAFDPFSPEDVRGVTPLASTFRKLLMAENLDDATAQMAFLQTIYAITITSDRPTAEVFEAFEAMKEVAGDAGTELATDFVDYYKAQLDRAAETEIRLGPGAGISQLVSGEKLGIETAKVPGKDYLPFAGSLHRETARALGVSYGGYTLDYTAATYASTMMENASLWPIATRRTDRIAAPHILTPYASWLDEQISEGLIPFKGGVEAYEANRDLVLWATCLGPSKPTADDLKAARAASERIFNGSSSLQVEASAVGQDADEVFEANERIHRRYVDAGMVSPFERKVGSKAASGDPDAQSETKEKEEA